MDKHDDLLEYLVLRDDAENTERHKRPIPLADIRLPTIRGVLPEKENAVELGAVLEATLGAVAGATGKLQSGNNKYLPGSEPMTLNLTGEILGVSPDNNQIYIDIKPRGKEQNNAS